MSLQPSEDSAPSQVRDGDGDMVAAVDASSSSAPAPAANPPQVTRKRAAELSTVHRKAVAKAKRQSAANIAAGSLAAASSATQGIPRTSREAVRPPLPQWVHRLSPTHDLIWVGGFVACLKCASIHSVAIGQRSRLLAECRGSHPVGSAGKLRKLREGELPHQETAWPDDRQEPSDRAPVAPLVHLNGRFAYLS